ncbi:MAG: ABC transporter permease subunit [Oscillospiraceae bacterium]|jgi:ABC-type transport system involved in multi-copper enzyme maturation permease subunit|nr:ABC transporter permease subunit [Oscillospiraceae bacterium]
MTKALKAEARTTSRDWSLLVCLAVYIGFMLIVASMAKYLHIVPYKIWPLDELNRMYLTSFTNLEDFISWHDAYIFTPDRWFMDWMSANEVTPFLAMIFPAFLIGRAFTSRTINIPVYAGISRGRILVSKVIVSYIVLAVFSFVGVWVPQLFYGHGVPGILSAGAVWTRVGLRILLDCAVMSIPVMVTFIFRDVIRSFAVNIAYILAYGTVISRIQGNPIIDFINKHHPMRLATTLGEHFGYGVPGIPLTSGRVIYLVGVSVGTIAVTSGISYLLFRKAELK